MSLTELAHQLINGHAEQHPKNLAVDATCGNGHDTEFLAKLGYTQVIGFDIQAKAIASTKHRLEKFELTNVTLINQGHEHLNTHINNAVDCFVFNFGYLPSADKNITTTATNSIKALHAAATLITDGGIMSLLCYPGHPNGAAETAAIQNWLNSLNDRWQIDTHLSEKPNETTPVLYFLQFS